jgi:hypothetical protein
MGRWTTLKGQGAKVNHFNLNEVFDRHNSDSFAETKAREENIEHGETENYKRPSLNSTDSIRTKFH